MTTSNTLTKTDLANILNEIVAIDGTDMTSQEIEDFVDSLNISGKGSPNGFGSFVDVSSYNSQANLFTCPTDGMIRLECNYRSGSYVMAYDENGQVMLEGSSNGSTNNAGTTVTSMPVYKGMKFYFNFASNGYSYAYFVPYTYD